MAARDVYDFEESLRLAAEQAGIPVEELKRKAGPESAGGKVRRNSLSSAKGSLQVIDDTFKRYNQRLYGGKLEDTDANRDLVGAHYLKDLHQKFGDQDLVDAAYFVGEGKVNSLLKDGGREAVMNYSVPGQGRAITVGEYVGRHQGGRRAARIETKTGDRRALQPVSRHLSSYGSEPGETDPGLMAPYRPLTRTPRTSGIPGIAAGLATTGGGDLLAAARADLAKMRGGRKPRRPEGETDWTDPLKNLAAGTVNVGEMGVGALEYGSRQLLGEDQLLTEQLAKGRRALTRGAEAITETMSPEAQDRLARQWTTLDPDQTIWQGGPGEIISSIGYKMGRSLPSTLVTLLPAARWMKAGMTPGAIAYLGASEGVLSMGGIANGISQEIEGMGEDELLAESPRYRQLLQQHGDPQAAREALITEAQGKAPLVGGVTVGAISAAAGRYLTPVFEGTGAGVAGRFGRGFAAETPQEASQSGAEQIAQNAAARIYDSDRGTFEGVPEATIEGGVIGGLTGGAFTAATGKRREKALVAEPQPEQETTTAADAVDPAIAAAIANSNLADANNQTGGIPNTLRGQGEMFPLGGQPDIVDMGVPPTEPQMAGPLELERGMTAEEYAAHQAPGQVPFAQENMFDLSIPTDQQALPARRALPIALAPREPTQRTLPLPGERVRQRGYAPTVPAPQTTPVVAPDMSVPGEFSNERLPLGEDVPMTEAEQKRRALYAGTVRDEGQADLFAAPAANEPIAETGGAQRQMLGFQVTGRAPDGTVRYTQDAESREEAAAIVETMSRNEQGELTADDTQWTVEPVSTLTGGAQRQTPDEPTAEPLSDIEAQLEDLENPDHPRQAVYLSRDAVAYLRDAGLLDQARSRGVPLPNFDLKGGIVIAKNRPVAEQLLAERKAGTPMQTILGRATLAGGGKPPEGARIAVQQRDERGRVTREALVMDEAEADARAAQWEVEDPARDVVQMDVRAAIRRRAVRRQEELARSQQEQGRRGVSRGTERALAGVGNVPLAEEARTVATAGFTETDPRMAATRLYEAAQQAETERGLRSEEGGGELFARPEDVRLEPLVEAPQFEVPEEGEEWPERRKAVKGLKTAAAEAQAAYTAEAKAERKAERAHAETVHAAEKAGTAAPPARPPSSKLQQLLDKAKAAVAEHTRERERMREERKAWVLANRRELSVPERKAATAARGEEANKRYREAFNRRKEARAEYNQLYEAYVEATQQLQRFTEQPTAHLRGEHKTRYEAEIAKRTAAVEAAAAKLHATQEYIHEQERVLRALLKSHKVDTTAMQLARAAEQVAPEEVRKLKRFEEPTEGQRTVAGRVRTREGTTVTAELVPTTDVGTLELMSEERIEKLTEGELEEEFLKAANFMSGLRPTRKRDLQRRGVAALGLETEGEAAALGLSEGIVSGRTFGQYIATHPRRSEKLKLIHRAQVELKKRQRPGAGKAHKITKTARRGQRGAAINLAPLFREEQSQEEREASAEKQAANKAKVTAAFERLMKAFKATTPLVTRLHAMDFAGKTGGEVLGRAYLQQLRQTVLALRASNNRTLNAARMANDLADVLEGIAEAKDDKQLLARITALGQAETKENIKAAAKSRVVDAGTVPVLKGTPEVMEAFDAWLNGDSKPMGNLLRSLTVGQLNFLRGMKWRTGPKAQQLLEQLTQSHQLWLDNAQKIYQEQLAPVLQLTHRGEGFKLPAEKIAAAAKAYDRVMTALDASYFEKRFGRHITGRRPTGPDHGSPTLLMEAPLRAIMKRNGFLFDDKGQVTGWKNPLAQETEARAAVQEEEKAATEREVHAAATAEVANRQRAETREKLRQKVDKAVREMLDAVGQATSATQVSEIETAFHEKLRRWGVWSKDGIPDLMPPGTRDYNARIGRQLKAKKITGPQALRMLRERWMHLGEPKAQPLVIEGKGMASRYSERPGSELPYRPDLTAEEFRALPKAEQAKIREARLKEHKRRANMTPEARRALERMEGRVGLSMAAARRGGGFQSEIDAAHQDAAESLRDLLGRRGGMDMRSMLTELTRTLPHDSPYRELLYTLQGVAGIQRVPLYAAGGGRATAEATSGNYFHGDDATSSFIELNLNGNAMQGADFFIHTVLHEAVHAATVAELINNPALRGAWQQLRRITYSRLNKEGVLQGDWLRYGDTNVIEFVAEVFSNKELQDRMKQMRSESFAGTLWDRVVELVRRLLGREQQFEHVLDIAMSLREQTFTGREGAAGDIERLSKVMGNTKEPTRSLAYTGVAAADDMIDRFRNTRVWRDTTTNVVSGNKETVTRGTLSALTMAQISDFYGKLFSDERGSALARYYDAFNHRNADNSRGMEEANRLSRRWTQLEEIDGTHATRLSEVMTDATVFAVHPDKSLSHPDNAHLRTAKQHEHYARIAAEFEKMSAPWKRLYGDVRDFYQQQHKDQQALATLNALRAVLTTGKDKMTTEAFNAKYTEGNILDARNLNTMKGLVTEFGDRLTKEQRRAVASIGQLRTVVEGPYFPLKRHGKYAIYARKLKSTKTFSGPERAREYEASLGAEDPTLQVKRDGNTVEVYDVEFRIAETHAQAKQDEAEMVAEYGRAAVSPYNIKQSEFGTDPAISGSSGLNTILEALEKNPAAQAAIKNFYLQSLADASFRKHEKKRENRLGFRRGEQHRTFAVYSSAAAYYMSQMRHGHAMGEARSDMQKLAKERGLTAGLVAGEIKLRDDMATSPEETPWVIQKATEMSQFMLLTSASYWLVNLTQPWLVTQPYLGGKYGQLEAAKALGAAQELIAMPLLGQAKTTWGGLKALKSKVAAEGAFTVMDDIEQHLRTKLGPAKAKPYLQMLEELKRKSIIDLTASTEIRQLAEGAGPNTRWQKALDASRIMSHLTEVNNRVMVAVATYNLATARGMPHEAATAAAEQALQETQFNYSGANSPRLFSRGGPLGVLSPVVFQFMKYPQHIYALLVKQTVRAMKGATPAERAEARKVLGGVLATHWAVGGFLGIVPQPFKILAGMLMAGLDDDDDRVQDVISGRTFDHQMRVWLDGVMGEDLGRAAAKGPVGEAIGIDLSTRMALGSLYLLDLNPESSETMAGSLLTSFGGPTVGLLTNAFRAQQSLAQGDVRRAVEHVSPKFVKDFLKAQRLASEGLRDKSGKTLIGAEKITAAETVMQTAGFGSMRTSESYDRGESIRVARDTEREESQRLKNRVLNATTPEERREAMQDVREFAKRAKNPLTYSEILRSMQSRKYDEAAIEEYGAPLRNEDVLFAEEGDPYDYEDEEE